MSNEAAMYGAVVRGDLQAISELLSRHPSLLFRSQVGKNWLQWSAQRGNIDVMKFLVNAGIPVDGLTDDGCSSALDIAAGQGRCDACEWLIDHGANVNRGQGSSATPIFSAIYSKSLELVMLFVERGADLSAVFGEPQMDVVSYGEQYGTPRIVEFLRQHRG